MKMSTLLSGVFLWVSIGMASAQMAGPPGVGMPQTISPEIQALQVKIMQELNAVLQCTTVSITLQQQMQKLTLEIEELKAKLEKSNAK